MIAVIFDTETTGLINSMAVPLERQPEIVQLHYRTVDLLENKTFDRSNYLLKPKKQITEEMTKIHGISNDMVKNEPSFEHIAKVIVHDFSTVDMIIAHNAQFDTDMMRIEMKRCNVEMTWPKIICTVEQTIWIKGYRLSLTNLHKELFNEDFDEKHSAEGDVEALARCCIEMVKRSWL